MSREMNMNFNGFNYSDKPVPNYTSQVLRQNEYMQDNAKLHWIIYFTNSFIWVGVMIMALGFAVELDRLTYPIVKWILLGDGFGFIFLGWVYVSLVRYSTEMVATTYRIIGKKGIIMRDVCEIRIATVESIEVHQTVMGRLLGYGTLMINGVGQNSMEFYRIENPIEFRNNVSF